jgi:hypothetical protein
MVVVTVVVTVVRVQVQVLGVLLSQLLVPSVDGAVVAALELVVLSPVYPAVVAVVVLLVVEPLLLEVWVQVIAPLPFWLHFSFFVFGVLSVLVSVLVWVARLS